MKTTSAYSSDSSLLAGNLSLRINSPAFSKPTPLKVQLYNHFYSGCRTLPRVLFQSFDRSFFQGAELSTAVFFISHTIQLRTKEYPQAVTEILRWDINQHFLYY